MFSELTSLLLRRRQEKDQAAARTREQVIADVADEKLTDPDEILDAIETVGLTPLSLETAVADLHHRRELQKVLSDESALVNQQADLDVKLEEARVKFLAAEKIWHGTQDSVRVELQGAQARLSQNENTKRSLRKSAPLVAREKVDDESLELSRLNSQRERLRVLLDSRRSFHMSSPTSREPTFVARRAELETEIRRCSEKHAAPSGRAKVPTMKTELTALAKEKRAAEKELSSVEKQIKSQMAKVRTADRELILA